MMVPRDHYGNPTPGPSGFADPHGYPPMRGGFTGPFPMGEGGTCPPHGYDLMDDVGTEGWLVDQRGPHYFDVRAEAVYLERDETFGREIIFSREGVPPGAPPDNRPLLSSNQLEYDSEPGFRIIGRYDICPLSVFEFGYTGIYSFEDSAFLADSNPTDPDLYSLFSNFGDETAFPDVTDPGGPGPFTERAVRHRISIESSLQTAELSYRRYWVGWIPRISGTLLAGFRYTRLNEEFVFSSLGGETVPFSDPFDPGLPLAALDYTVDADNHLAGFQAGGDIWVGLIQGLRVGAEGKVGLYNNHYTLENRIVTTPVDTTPPTLFERFRENQPAFIAEASADVVADILPSWSLRAGYEVLFINSIVLAGENFNTGSPYNPGPLDNSLGPVRVPFVEDQGDVFYHGFHAGLEYIW